MIEKIYYRFHNAISRPGEKGEYSSGYWQDKIRQNAKNICINRKGKLLDVGCGEGLFLAQVMKEIPDLKVWGVDGWAEILTKAKNRLEKIKSGVTLLKSDASILPFEDDFFDVVVCVNVFFNMESIEKVSSALKEMVRVCKTGGSIIFDFRNSLNPLLLIKYRFAKYYDQTVNDLHLNTYSPGDMRNILERAGLEVVQERPLSFPIKTFAPIILMETIKK